MVYARLQWFASILLARAACALDSSHPSNPRVGSSNLSERASTYACKSRISCGFGFVLEASSVLQGITSRYEPLQGVTNPYNHSRQHGRNMVSSPSILESRGPPTCH